MQEKVRIVQLGAVGTQVDDLLQPVGGISGLGTAVVDAIPGEMVWENAVLGVSCNTIGGSWSVDAVTVIDGISFPIFRRNTFAGRSIMTNLMNASWCPRITHIAWDETAAGGITATVVGMFKGDRGYLPRQGSNSKKVVIGRIIATIGDIGTTQANGVTNADRLIALSRNPTASPFSRQNASFAGSDQMHLWDCGGFFMRVVGASGSYQVSLLSSIQGQTYLTAAFPAVTGVTRVTAVNATTGAMPRPTHIFFDAPSGGAVGLTADIYFVGKGTRGRRTGA